MTPGEDITVAVFDDHQLFREGLAEILGTIGGVQVVAQGDSGTAAVEVAGRMRPAVVVIDVQMPGPPAQETVQRIRAASPHTRVVVVTMHDDAELLVDLITAGASAYVVKNADRVELTAAVRSAVRPDDLVFLAVSRATVHQLGRRPPPTAELLTDREAQVLQALARARSTAEMSAELMISQGTVKRHLTNVYRKLGAVSRMDAVRRAEELGLLAPRVPPGRPHPRPSAPRPPAGG